ncbi:hypothetical protein ACKVEX_15495 [Rhodocyclaceae bacterium SMB388]
MSVKVMRLGVTTRTEALLLLGEPWLTSRRWGLDLWRVTDRESQAGMAFLLYVPLFGGVFGTDWEAYALMSWDAQERLVARDHQLVIKSGIYPPPAKPEMEILGLRAGEFSLTNVTDRGQVELWSDGTRLPDYLAERAAAGVCTLVVSCSHSSSCPSRISVDELDPMNLRIIVVRSRRAVGSILAMHTVDLPPGDHYLRVAGAVTEVAFTCAAGEALFAVVEAHVTGASSFSGSSVVAEVTFTDDLPTDWTAYRGWLLWRDGRWLVAPD